MSDKSELEKKEATEDEADDTGAAETDEDVVEMDDGDLQEEGDVFKPDLDAKPEPFWALMELDEDGETTGSVWSFGGRLMLFKESAVAEKLQKNVSSEQTPFGIRGVTHEHLQALKNLASTQQIPLFVITGFTAEGKVEAHPIAEVEPPSLPPSLS